MSHFAMSYQFEERVVTRSITSQLPGSYAYSQHAVAAKEYPYTFLKL
jgi:hypothetical protein